MRESGVRSETSVKEKTWKWEEVLWAFIGLEKSYDRIHRDAVSLMCCGYTLYKGVAESF